MQRMYAYQSGECWGDGWVKGEEFVEYIGSYKIAMEIYEIQHGE